MVTFSIVIETENLALAGVDSLDRCLGSLERQTHDIRTANEVWLMVGTHLPAADAERVCARYPWITIHQSNAPLTYLGSKKRGAELATGEVVVYCDSDVAYEPEWLGALLAEHDKRGMGQVVATGTRVLIESAYGFAMQAVWMLQPVRPAAAPRPSPTFHLNNFVIDRDVMAATAIDESLPLFRGALSYWRQRIRNAGVQFTMVPSLIALHLPPNGVAEWFWRLMIYGADYVAAAEYCQGADGAVRYRPSLRKRLWAAAKWMPFRVLAAIDQISTLLRSAPQVRRHAILGIPLAMLFLPVIWLGSVVAVFAPRYCFDKITALEA